MTTSRVVGITVPASHPNRLGAEGVRRGMRPAAPQRCRVLELGCGAAHNIAAMAFHLPESHFVGVDASAAAFEVADETRARLGLDNLELLQTELHALDPSALGEFDYIICHDVVSWVDVATRDHLWRLMAACLGPQGILCLGYATHAGRSIRLEIRQALSEATRDLDTMRAKIMRARAILQVMARTARVDTPAGTLLAQSAEMALAFHDERLMQEYLSDAFQGFDYSEVADAAKEHNLVAFGELTRGVVPVSWEDGIRDALEASNHGQSEELTDLILQRDFRLMVMHRKDAELTEHSDWSQGTFAAYLSPRAPRPDLAPNVAEVFLTSDGTEVSVSDSILKVALLTLGQAWPRGLSIQALGEAVSQTLQDRRLKAPGEMLSDSELTHVRQDLLALLQMTFVDYRLWEPVVASEVGAQPRVSAWTRHEAGSLGVATNPHHRVGPLNAFLELLVRSLDGSRSWEALTERMFEHWRAEDFVLQANDGETIEPQRALEIISELVKDALNHLQKNGLLMR